MPGMDDAALTRAIFARSWQCLAHESQMPAPGDYVAETIAGLPVIAVRGADGVIRAFRNACRHRLSPFTEDGTGSCGAELACPYHGWRYALDGRLKSATGFGPAENFDARALSLVSLPLKLWRGFLFVALSTDAGDFDAWIAPVTTRLKETPLEGWHFAARRQHDVACRWTLYVENYLEGYHVPVLHKALDAEIDSAAYRVTIEDRIAIHHAPLRPERRDDAVYEGLWAWAWPNLGINVYQTGMMMERIWPMPDGTTRLDYLYVFADQNADHSATFAMSDVVTAEDKMICEAVERNLAAGDIEQGPLSPTHENAVSHFRSLVADAALEAAAMTGR